MHNELTEKIIVQSSGVQVQLRVCSCVLMWGVGLHKFGEFPHKWCSNEENYVKNRRSFSFNIRKVYLYISSHLGDNLNFPVHRLCLLCSTRLTLYMLGFMVSIWKIVRSCRFYRMGLDYRLNTPSIYTENDLFMKQWNDAFSVSIDLTRALAQSITYMNS